MWTARDDRLFLPVAGTLIVLAWLALWIWGHSPYDRYLTHHSLDEIRGRGLLAPVFVAGWTLMVIAMMLPTGLGVITFFRALTRQRQNRALLTLMLITGYLAVWALFGVAVYLNDLIVHEAVEWITWLEARAWLIAAATLGMAGAYQFTALKYRCLDRCRSPRSFVMEHWRGRRERWEAWRLGVHHGLFCLGCCWGMMLLTFAIGVGNLGWMFVLGTVMAVEKNAPWGRRLSAPLGVMLLAAALALPLVIAAQPDSAGCPRGHS